MQKRIIIKNIYEQNNCCFGYGSCLFFCEKSSDDFELVGIYISSAIEEKSFRIFTFYEEITDEKSKDSIVALKLEEFPDYSFLFNRGPITLQSISKKKALF